MSSNSIYPYIQTRYKFHTNALTESGSSNFGHLPFSSWPTCNAYFDTLFNRVFVIFVKMIDIFRLFDIFCFNLM